MSYSTTFFSSIDHADLNVGMAVFQLPISFILLMQSVIFLLFNKTFFLFDKIIFIHVFILKYVYLSF